jgi:hypothetical protein
MDLYVHVADHVADHVNDHEYVNHDDYNYSAPQDLNSLYPLSSIPYPYPYPCGLGGQGALGSYLIRRKNQHGYLNP